MPRNPYPTQTITLQWPAPTKDNPDAVVARCFEVVFDLGTIDAIERATGMAISEIAQSLVKLHNDTQSLSIGLLYRIIAGCLQGADPSVTLDQVRAAVHSSIFWSVTRQCATGLGATFRQLIDAQDGAAADPTPARGSGDGSAPKSDTAPTSPAA